MPDPCLVSDRSSINIHPYILNTENAPVCIFTLFLQYLQAFLCMVTLFIITIDHEADHMML